MIILNEGSDLSIEELKESIGQCKYLIVDNNITLNNELQKEFIEKERDDKYTTYLAKFLY